jgi:MFS family permease
VKSPTSIKEATSLLPVLRNRHFLLMWLAQGISMTAQNATWFALAIMVENATKSSLQLSFVILSSIIPPILLSLVAGAMVDRMDKRNVMVATNLLRAGVVLGYLLFDPGNPASVIMIYLVNILFVSVGQFFGPAEYAMIPAVVPRRQLVAANALYNLTFNASQLLGIVFVAPLMLKLFPPAVLFAGEAIAYVIAGGLVALLTPEPPIQPLSTLRGTKLWREMWVEIQEGWAFIRRDPFISLAVAHLTLLSTLLLVVAMIGPRFTVAVLEMQADDAVFLLGPAVGGILVATVVVSRLVNTLGKQFLIGSGLVVLGGGMLILSMLRWVTMFISGVLPRNQGGGMMPIMVALTIVLGFSIGTVMIPAQTIIMERTLGTNRGRVFSVQLLLANLAAILPLVFLGAIADRVGVEVVIGIGAIGVCIFVAFNFWRLHTLRGHKLSDLALEPGPEEAEPS